MATEYWVRAWRYAGTVQVVGPFMDRRKVFEWVNRWLAIYASAQVFRRRDGGYLESWWWSAARWRRFRGDYEPLMDITSPNDPNIWLPGPGGQHEGG